MAKLAILNGEKAVKIDSSTASLPLVSEEAINAVVELLRKGEISTSPVVREFEKNFGDYIGAKYSLAVNSGTSSLHEALFAVGVGPGDEVIVPSFTWIFTVAPIVASHGIPVFCDVDIDTHCIDPEDIKRKITPRTKAIMVVHVWGNPANMDEIMKIAKENNLRVIEDCAHAHGTMWKGKKVGIIGDVGCYSLQGSKTLAAGEGGVLVTNNHEYYERAVALGHYERVSGLPEDSEYRKYTTSLGFKHRVHPLGIAIVNTELKYLDEKNAIRSENARYLEEGIKDIECIIPQRTYPGGVRQHSYHYARYDETKLEGVSLMTFLKALKAEGVVVGAIGYGRLHEAPLFLEKTPYGKGCPGRCPHVKVEYPTEKVSLPNTEYLREHAFMMAPRFEKPCRELLNQYIEAYHKVVRNVDELKEYEKKYGVETQDVARSGRSINLI
ncbi:MAG: DegT/DnrJ/EryC1/StrS family aminotransferase [Firmicutes bacterium]|nr:DegT/DnrJ/EryC1/StrS family aminotransferase [Bacillota bacterium]